MIASWERWDFSTRSGLFETRHVLPLVAPRKIRSSNKFQRLNRISKFRGFPRSSVIGNFSILKGLLLFLLQCSFRSTKGAIEIYWGIGCSLCLIIFEHGHTGPKNHSALMAFSCVQCFSQSCVRNTAETSNNVSRSSTHHVARHSPMRRRFDEKVHWTRCSSSAGCAVVPEGRGTADAKHEWPYCSKTNEILWMRRSRQSLRGMNNVQESVDSFLQYLCLKHPNLCFWHGIRSFQFGQGFDFYRTETRQLVDTKLLKIAYRIDPRVAYDDYPAVGLGRFGSTVRPGAWLFRVALARTPARWYTRTSTAPESPRIFQAADDSHWSRECQGPKLSRISERKADTYAGTRSIPSPSLAEWLAHFPPRQLMHT